MVKKKNESNTDQDEKWQHEIELLERRVKTHFVDVDLSDGDSIAIRACLSDADIGRLAELQRKKEKLNPEKDEAKLNEIGYEIMELITANPMLTKQYFQDKRDKYSTEDILKIFFGYYDQMGQRAQKISKRLKKATEN